MLPTEDAVQFYLDMADSLRHYNRHTELSLRRVEVDPLLSDIIGPLGVPSDIFFDLWKLCKKCERVHFVLLDHGKFCTGEDDDYVVPHRPLIPYTRS